MEEVRLEDLGSPTTTPPCTQHTHAHTSQEHPPIHTHTDTCASHAGLSGLSLSSCLAQPTITGFWAPPTCTHLLGADPPRVLDWEQGGSWDLGKKLPTNPLWPRSAHQTHPGLWGTVYFSMKAVSRSSEPLCRRWI